MSSDRTGDVGGTLSRRRFLAGAAAVGAAAWAPVFQVTTAAAQDGPPNFPPSIPIHRQAFENWAGEIVVDDVWTCVPATPADVVTVVNWAHANAYRVRARGMGHGWSPLVVPPGSGGTSVVLVDTTRHLTAVTIQASGSPATVTAQTGVTMDVLLADLELAGLGVTATPAPGDLTLGGVLAIDGHGTALPVAGETRVRGTTFGSLSNLVLAFTAVVWDSTRGRYVLRTFLRSDTAAAAFMVHAGRALLTEATLQVGVNSRLRCQSRVDIPVTTLLGPPGTAGPTFASFIESSGRVEAIWYPYTDHPWLKVWSVSPARPLFSREVTSPYNYPFSDNLPETASDLIARIVNGDGAVTPIFGATELSVTATGLLATASADIWGWSKNLLLYIRPSTLRATANGYAIMTSRASIQRVVSELAAFYQSRLLAYQARSEYPVNTAMEIRATGLDLQSEVDAPSPRSPQLSALRPRPDHPEWDVIVWFDILTIPGTPSSERFYRDIELFLFTNYTGSYAAVRPEWSKGWGYSGTAAWSDPTMLSTTLPNGYRTGQMAGDSWDTALATLNAHDPHRVFSNTFLDTLMP
jgi:FAD/FMN-containing dehydrogenase